MFGRFKRLISIAMLLLTEGRGRRMSILRETTEAWKGTSMKKSYEAPKLIEVGAFEEITMGNATGPRTDFSLDDNTPAEDVPDPLTFS